MKNFRTLNLAIEFYTEAKGLNFQNPARDQFRRALLSVCLNLAEGSEGAAQRIGPGFTPRDLGSLREAQALLYLHDHKTKYAKADRLGAMIFRLIQNPGSAPVP